MASKLLLLPKLLPADLVDIGYLVPNPLCPSVNPWPNVVPEDECTAPSIERNYQTRASTGIDGSLKASLATLFGLEMGAKHTNTLKITAEEMRYRTLKNGDATFARICESEATRSWIYNMMTYNRKIYFIVGLQELRNASFQRSVSRKSAYGAGVFAPPLLDVASLPIDAAASLRASVEGGVVGNTDGTVCGIFGIEVRKVKYGYKKNKDDEPTLQDKVSWTHMTDRVKSGGSKSKPITVWVSLSDTNEEDLDLERDDDDAEEDSDLEDAL